MTLFDKLNPLKKKEDFPEFGDSLGAKTSSVPGPSFDAEPISGIDDPASTMPVVSPEPINNSQLNSIQSTLNLLVSKIESMKSSLDGLSQRVNSLEQKHSSNQPRQQTPQPQFNPYQPQAQQQSEPQQQQNQQPTQTNEDEGWHF